MKILAKYSFPKKILESKIANPKKSFGHARHLKSLVPPPPAPGGGGLYVLKPCTSFTNEIIVHVRPPKNEVKNR